MSGSATGGGAGGAGGAGTGAGAVSGGFGGGGAGPQAASASDTIAASARRRRFAFQAEGRVIDGGRAAPPSRAAIRYRNGMDDPTAPSSLSTPCPSCGLAMAIHRLERKPTGVTTIDVCAGCRALWFDGYESLQLTPGATLALLKAIRDAEGEPKRAQAARLACPRCSGPLALTRDLQRSTRFTYFRCERGHGRYTPFAQFLLEKSFVRPLPPAEIERLRRSVGTIRCSGCGAAIELAADTACRYCRAPVSVLDPDALSRTVEALTAAEARRHEIDPVALADGLLAAERFNRALAEDAPPRPAPDAILAAIRMGATALDILFSARR